MIWFAFAFLIERVQVVITGKNYGARWNGYGAINGTINKTADAPMVYRVLVPWIIGALERIHPRVKLCRLEIYEALKIILIGLAFWSINRAWNFNTAILVAAILPITFRFDYWDWSAELAGVAMAMTGEVPLAIIGATIAGLSKETAPLVPLAYLSVTGDVPIAVILMFYVGILWVLIRMVQGEHKLYCDRWMVKRNLQELKRWKSKPVFLSDMAMSIAITVLAIIAMLHFQPGWIIPLAIIGAGWTLAVGAETRIFVVALPWIAGMFV